MWCTFNALNLPLMAIYRTGGNCGLRMRTEIRNYLAPKKYRHTTMVGALVSSKGANLAYTPVQKPYGGCNAPPSYKTLVQMRISDTTIKNARHRQICTDFFLGVSNAAD